MYSPGVDRMGRVGLISLGCPKALVDSEQILSRLRAEGYTLVDSDDAEVVVVNTCGFITPAVEESLNTIGERLEKSKVVVTGCLGARPEVILERHPGVVAVTGPGQVEEVVRAIRQVLPAPSSFEEFIPPQIKLTPRHYAYLKIAEGCNHRCRFCIIPKLRGPQISRPASQILEEARRLVAQGTRELLIIAQDTAAYGLDLSHAPGARPILSLVEELAQLGVWVRLHYVYPYPWVRDLVERMAEGKLLPYLDVPLQHASPKVLKAMRRPAGTRNYLKEIQEWRSICPQLAIRSTFIVGFPGETQEDFEELLDFLEAAQLDRVGVFTYSEVEGAEANALPGRVPEELKEERRALLLARQREISWAKHRARIGQRLTVLIDERAPGGKWAGRSPYDAPGIDGQVIARGEARIGEFAEVRITSAGPYDLFGEILTS
jgi:ribosomal protein S12 methylthiotransferase